MLLAGRSPGLSLIPKGIDLIGYDFRQTGPRYSYTNRFVDVAPGGTLVTGITRRATPGQEMIIDVSGDRTLDRWDLTNGGFALAANSSLELNDCKLKPDIPAIASFICIDIANDNVNVVGVHCDLDGGRFQQSGQACMARVRASAVGSSMSFSHSRVHGLGSDGFNGGYLTLDHMWFYDAGYGHGAHSDYCQIIGGNHIVVSNSLFDGLIDGQPIGVNNALRLVAEAGGAIDGVTVTNCILSNFSAPQPPLAIGLNDDTPGIGAVNFDIHGNWIRKHPSNAAYVYTEYGPSGGTNRWYENRDLDTLESINAPAIGTWLGAP